MPHHASFRRAFMILTLLVLAFVLSFFADAAVEQFMRAEQDKTVRLAARRISRWGDAPVLLAAGVGVLGFAVWRRDRRTTRLVAIMLLSAISAGVVANTLRGATGRARPDADHGAGWYGVYHQDRWVIGKRDYSAFPSAHTSVAVAFFVPLLFAAARRAGVGPISQMLALTAPVLIAWARVYLSVHHLSDVVAGAVVGLSCAMLASCSRPAWRLRHWFRTRAGAFIVLPSAPARTGILEREKRRLAALPPPEETVGA